jgi:site-specific recombinase XerD
MGADRWPVLGRHERAAEWLQLWADLGRAPGTIDAYAQGLAEYLQVCERDGEDPLVAGRAQVAAFVRELASRPSLRGANVVSIDSGAGLANATLQQRLVAVRLFYEFWWRRESASHIHSSVSQAESWNPQVAGKG